MSHPLLAFPPRWRRLEKVSGSISCTPCYWSDVEAGLVVPKYSGQVFYFADLGEMWVYVQEPVRSSWVVRFIIALGVTLLALESVAIYELFQRLREAGMLWW